jgi:hypothetical protein
MHGLPQRTRRRGGGMSPKCKYAKPLSFGTYWALNHTTRLLALVEKLGVRLEKMDQELSPAELPGSE